MPRGKKYEKVDGNDSKSYQSAFPDKGDIANYSFYIFYNGSQNFNNKSQNHKYQVIFENCPALYSCANRDAKTD